MWQQPSLMHHVCTAALTCLNLLELRSAQRAWPAAARAAAAAPQMVLRVTALRGSVPAPWVTDFSAALEKFGVAALSQRPQLTDIYAELKGNK